MLYIYHLIIIIIKNVNKKGNRLQVIVIDNLFGDSLKFICSPIYP